MQILHWKIDPELEREARDNYRTSFALGMQNYDALHIIRELTFDGSAKNITVSDIERLFDFVEKKFLHKKISGVGLEIGGGPGTFSSILAKRQNVDKVYDVEVCRPIVEVLGPKVSRYILGDKDSRKVIGVVGDFDHMELPTASVDFVFDFFSLHHSLNPTITLTECKRILKPGGFIFCFDKARPDYYTKEDLDELLDAEYNETYKRQFGLPLDQKLTRRMNGEREYRLKDWLNAFQFAGFSKFEHYYLAKVMGGGFSEKLKHLIAIMPITVRLKVTRLLPKPNPKHKFILAANDRVFTRLINKFPKETSLMIARK